VAEELPQWQRWEVDPAAARIEEPAAAARRE